MRAHVVGAGLAGLNAAVELARAGVQVHLAEAAPRAGGRCRSYHDPQLGQVIDNGNHFTFSGNQAVSRFLETLGTAGKLEGPEHAEFPFHDLTDGSRWTLRVNDGRVPLWMFSKSSRTPGTTVAQHLPLARLALARRDGRAIGDVMEPQGPFWRKVVDDKRAEDWEHRRKVVEPMMLAVLNCPAAQGSAWLAGRFLRESFLRGGRACRTMVAMPSLDAVFIEPALDWLKLRGVTPRFGARLRAIGFEGDRVSALDYGEGMEPIHDAAVVLAVPPWVAGDLVPDLSVPNRFCAILNAHFACPPPEGAPPITALLGATSQWVVCHGDRISVTISGADDIIDADREGLARTIWAEVSATLGIQGNLPAWQIVKEKRATFAATPDQDALRPAQQTRWRNLFLAGDWVQTGLPATIEGALRSGHNAANLALGHGLVYGAGQ
jgi:squalene-associated FAD-dependent desaturase